MQSPRPEARQSLWALITGPLIWLVHFALTYITAAIWCARYAGKAGNLTPAAIAIAVYTGVALLFIALSAHRGFRRHRFGESAGPPHDADTSGDRHRFLGFACLLLCGLAATATVFVAMTVVFIRSCR